MSVYVWYATFRCLVFSKLLRARRLMRWFVIGIWGSLFQWPWILIQEVVHNLWPDWTHYGNFGLRTCRLTLASSSPLATSVAIMSCVWKYLWAGTRSVGAFPLLKQLPYECTNFWASASCKPVFVQTFLQRQLALCSRNSVFLLAIITTEVSNANRSFRWQVWLIDRGD